MLSPLVMKCATEDDKVCLDIINRSADHLLELPEALQKEFKNKTVDVALLGGIVENDTLLSKLLKEKVEKSKKLNLVEPKGTALHGALAIGVETIENLT